MNKIKRIAMLAHGFVGWGGGVDFLKAYVTPLQAMDNTELYLIITKQKENVVFLKGLIKRLLGKEVVAEAVQDITEISKQFECMGMKVVFCEYYTKYDFLDVIEKCLKANNIDIVFPTLIDLGKKFPIPWVIYVPDFQHKYYPEFFSKEECNIRDKGLAKLLRQKGRCVIVESEDTKNDIFKFYPKTKANVFVMPYTAIPEKEWFNLNNIDISPYGLDKQYFLVSNQLWIHKSHITAINALAKLRKEGYDVDLVCTGKTEDYRNPNYYEWIRNEVEKLGIGNNVHFLGYIPKLEQIKLLKGSVAAIQPTLFEGNPGGGIAYNAISLGVPIILSDIPVNLELNSELAVFFESKNADDLANKMKQVIQDRFKYPKYSEKELVWQGQQRLHNLENVIKKVIEEA